MQLATPHETTKKSRHLLAPDPAEKVAHGGAAMVAPSIWLHFKSPRSLDGMLKSPPRTRGLRDPWKYTARSWKSFVLGPVHPTPTRP
eukprot:3356691-Pyramimonas_sp.AAC.1